MSLQWCGARLHGYSAGSAPATPYCKNYRSGFGPS